jgi:hypothetical protein
MNAQTAIAPAPGQARPDGTDPAASAAVPRPEVRAKVRELLSQSEAFAQLSPAQQQQVARDTALVADTLVGQQQAADMRSMAMNDQFKEGQKAVEAIGEDPFTAGAAREGAYVAGEFLKQINFVEFVSGLIDGVFNSIVTSSIEQMEAYSKMVADVSKSLNQFRDENTTDDDGKDQLIEQFPDVFDIGVDEFSGSGQPKLRMRDGVDQDTALARVQSTLGGLVEGGIDSIDAADPEAEAKLIQAARSHIATARQQLLATMVMMGLSRIVVTNGKIQAKIMYDFNASSQRTLSRSAQARDYARKADGSLDLLSQSEGEYDRGGKHTGDYERAADGSYKGNYDSDYYTKGKYKYAQKPVMTAMSVASDMQNEALTARASLAGNVEVNFKSDYLPLDKMATPEMMAAIQMRSKPVDHNKPIYKPGAAPAQQGGQAPQPQAGQ